MNISFAWGEPTSLAAELCRPIKRVSMEFEPRVGKPMFVTLWQSDGKGLRLYSQMHDIAERTEVGVLNFERVSAPRPGEMIVDVAPAFQGDVAVSKLTIHESGTNAESGVVLKAGNGDEILVVAAAYPYFLAVSGVVSAPYIFDPEYPIDRYMRVPVT